MMQGFSCQSDNGIFHNMSLLNIKTQNTLWAHNFSKTFAETEIWFSSVKYVLGGLLQNKIHQQKKQEF